MSKSQIDWKKYVDKIYIITYTTRRNNEFFYEELNRVGIMDYPELIHTFENIHTPFYKDLFNTIVKNNNKDRYYNYGPNTLDIEKNTEYSYVFDAAMAHYYCFKHAQQHNYEKILVLEDDILFLKDISQIKILLDNAYNQYSKGFMFLGNLGHIVNDKYRSTYQCNEVFEDTIYMFTNDIDYCGGAGFNIYDNVAYEYIINYYESYNYSPLDVYSLTFENALNNNLIKIWVSKTYVAIQYNWLSVFMFSTILYNIEPVKIYKEEIFNNMINFQTSYLNLHDTRFDQYLFEFNLLLNELNNAFFEGKLEIKDYLKLYDNT